MKYYSTILSKFYDTPEACEEAEHAAEKAEAERHAAEDNAKTEIEAQKHVVDELRDQYVALGKQYNEAYGKLNRLATSFSRKYGYLPKGFSTFDIMLGEILK